MIMMDGLFMRSAPGNFFILPGERIAFIDFGMIGASLRSDGTDYETAAGVAANDAEASARFLLEWLTEEETTRGTVRSR